MKIVLCLDKSGGLLFGGRRQSQDRVLREKLLELVGDGKLFLGADRREPDPDRAGAGEADPSPMGESV